MAQEVRARYFLQLRTPRLSITVGEIGEREPRKSKRKASDESEEVEEDSDGDSSGRNTAAPKRVRLQESAESAKSSSLEDHVEPQSIPFTPAGPASGARTVLEKGLNNALFLFRNFSGAAVSAFLSERRPPINVEV